MTLSFTTKSEDLTPLLDIIDEYQNTYHNTFNKVEAVASKTSFLSSGVPELTELIIALGSSGAFVAIQAILKSYFAKRPKSELFLETKDHGKASRIAVRNADPEVLKSFFDHLNQQL